MTRGSPASVEIRPTALLERFRSGRPNCGVLNMLNISQRNSRLSPKHSKVLASTNPKLTSLRSFTCVTTAIAQICGPLKRSQQFPNPLSLFFRRNSP
jgi:hypothetical protein